MFNDKRLTFGFILPHIINSPITNDLCKGAFEKAKELNINIVLYVGERLESQKGLKAKENEVYSMVDKNKIDGLLIWTSNVCQVISDEEIKKFHDYYFPVPVVTIGKKIDDHPVILLDSYNSMKEEVNHMIKVHGYKKIGFIQGLINSFYAEERFRAYKDALKENKIAYKKDLVTPPRELVNNGGYDAIVRFFDTNKLKIKKDIEAIIASSDEFIISAVEELEKRGYKIPQDIAIAGFDNVLSALAQKSPITTIDIFYSNAGKLAVKKLFDLVNGNKGKEIEISHCKVIYRESCGCKNRIINNSVFNFIKTKVNKDNFPDDLIKYKNKIIENLKIFLDNIYNSEEANMIASEIFNNFIKDLKNKEQDVFINFLKNLLLNTKDDIENYNYWHDLITEFNKEIINYSCFDSSVFYYIEKIFHQSRILILSIFDYFQSKYIIDEQYMINTVLNTSQQIVTTVELVDLKDVIYNICPKLKVDACYIFKLDNNINLSSIKKLIVFDNRLKKTNKDNNFDSNSSFIPDIIFDNNNVNNIIMMPLYFKEKTLGYVVFRMGTDDGQIYTMMKNQISTALQQIFNIIELKESETKREELFNELEFKNDQLNKALNALWNEIDVAKNIQISFLPSNLNIPGYDVKTYIKSASEIGGDFFDLIKGRDDKYWLTIGDVSGHGVTAGLIMMMLQMCNLNNILINPDIMPDELIILANKTINYNLKNRLKLDQFVTSCFLKFDNDGFFNFSGAHEKILIYRAKSKKVEEIKTTGMWLAVVDDISNFITLNNFKLEKNDAALFYTDGVTEITNELKDLYGLERLESIFEKNGDFDAETILNNIINDINVFKNIQRDDITLVILKKI